MKVDRIEILRWMAYIGAASAVAGFLRYSIQGEMLLPNKIMLIGGGALFLIAAIFAYREIIQFFSKRSSRLGTNTLTLGAIVLVILGLLNFLGYRHHKRFDLTTEKLYTLSDQTKKVVSGLKKDVEVMRFAKVPDQQFSALMTEYASAGRNLHYQVVDPQQKPEIAQQYGVKRMDQVVVASGDRKEILEGTEEQDVTNAIVKVTRDAVKTVCFVEGHGERGITESDQDGLTGVDRFLKNESYQTKGVNLVASSGVPDECTVLVLAGPKQSLLAQESQAISKYLDGGGKALFLFDPDTEPKVDDILQAWNINMGTNVVVDASGVGQMLGLGAAAPLVIEYGSSPITRNFERSMTFFPLARTVAMADKAKAQPQEVELLKTSQRSFTVPNLRVKQVKFDPAKDSAGPLSLGVAGDKKLGAGENAKDARLVVIGNSAFAANQYAGMARNGDLFVNIVDWLAQDEDLISIRPKSQASRRVTLTESQERELSWFSLVFLPGVVLLSGAYIWWKRR